MGINLILCYWLYHIYTNIWPILLHITNIGGPIWSSLWKSRYTRIYMSHYTRITVRIRVINLNPPAASPEILHQTVRRTCPPDSFTQMRDDHTHSHCLTYTFLFETLGESTCWTWMNSAVAPQAVHLWRRWSRHDLPAGIFPRSTDHHPTAWPRFHSQGTSPCLCSVVTLYESLLDAPTNAFNGRIWTYRG